MKPLNLLVKAACIVKPGQLPDGFKHAILLLIRKK
jgi:hypothetical protein